jgi:hypothetical protein
MKRLAMILTFAAMTLVVCISVHDLAYGNPPQCQTDIGGTHVHNFCVTPLYVAGRYDESWVSFTTDTAGGSIVGFSVPNTPYQGMQDPSNGPGLFHYDATCTLVLRSHL